MNTTTTVTTKITTATATSEVLTKLSNYYNKNYYHAGKNADPQDCQPRNSTSSQKALLEVTSSFVNGCVIESPVAHLSNAIKDAKSQAEDILESLQELYQGVIENKESPIMQPQMIAQLEKRWNLLKQIQGSLKNVTSNENLSKIFNQLKFNADFLKEKFIYIKKTEQKFIEHKKVLKPFPLFEQVEKMSRIANKYREFCRNFILAENRAELNTEYNRMHTYHQHHLGNHYLHQNVNIHL